MNRLRAALLSLEQPLAARSEGDLPPESDIPIQRRRGLSFKTTSPVLSTRLVLDTPAEAYDAILRKQAEYLQREDAALWLQLFRIQPGAGKTTQTIITAEDMVRTFGVNAGYLGPRGNFYEEILAKSSMPEQWQRWYKHQGFNEAKPDEPATCKWETEIDVWLEKGHEPFDFCKIADTCGERFYTNGCVYTQQARQTQKLTYLHHKHGILGNPKMKNMAFIVGDEMPLSSFLHPWTIPLTEIVPKGLDRRIPFAHILAKMKELCQRETLLEGEALYTLLGGAEAVYAAAASFDYDPNAAYAQAWATDVLEARSVPYNYLAPVQQLLLRETGRMKDGLAFIPRIVLYNNTLILLLRHEPHADLADKPIIWLDGTGHPHLYKTLFRREVETIDIVLKPLGKLYQLWTKANGMTALFATEEEPTSAPMPSDPPALSEDTEPISSKRLEEIKLAILFILQKKGYKRPGIVTFKKCVDFFADIPSVTTGYFYAERGSNRFMGCDVVFVVGTPLPSLQAMQLDARMLYFERDEPFSKEWSVKPVAYNYSDEQGRSAHYDVSGYWDDTDLQTIVEINRENEQEQAAERSRRSIQFCDAWLFSNIPNPNLTPNALLTERELFGSPKEADPYTWASVCMLSDAFYSQGRAVTASDLRLNCGIKSATTALKYWNMLAAAQPDRWTTEAALVPRSHGKRAKTLYPLAGNA